MHLHYREEREPTSVVKDLSDGETQSKSEEQKSMLRLSDDEDEVCDENFPFKDFLVVSHCKSEARP